MNMWRPAELALTGVAKVAWPVLQSVNPRVRRESPCTRSGRRDRCSKSHQRTKPPLGWPRTHRFALPDLRP